MGGRDEAIKGRITRLWLTMIRVPDIKKVLNSYIKILGLQIALDARVMEIGPEEPLAKIGLFATGKNQRKKNG